MHHSQQLLSMSTPVDMLAVKQQRLYVHGMGIAGRIKQRLNELGQIPAWLASEAKISQSALSALITRDSKRSETWPAIAKALRVNDRWLTTGEGPKERNPDGLTPADQEAIDQWSLSAQKLATLFDLLPVERRQAAWPWLVRMLTTSPALLKTYLPFPAGNERVKRAYGNPAEGRKRRKPVKQ